MDVKAHWSGQQEALSVCLSHQNAEGACNGEYLLRNLITRVCISILSGLEKKTTFLPA